MNLVELGVMLREKREERGLEIKDVADILKISINVLVALEDANREKLPELAFRIAFVKSYCRFLEFDDALVAEAIKCLSFVGEEPNYANKHRIENEYITNTLPEKKNLKITVRILAAVGVILFAYIAASAFMESNLVRGLIEEAENSPYLTDSNTPAPKKIEIEAETQAPAEIAPNPGAMSEAAAAKLDELVQQNLEIAIENSKNKKAPVAQERAKPAIDADERIGSGSQTLVITAKQACWMQITLDGKLVRGNYTLEQGKNILLEYNTRAIIFLGNPSGVEIVHNGTKQKPFPDTGKTLSVAY